MTTAEIQDWKPKNIKPYYEDESTFLILGDCLEYLPKLEPNINLVCIDPPYHKIMEKDWKGEKFEWDNQWKSFVEYREWFNNISKLMKNLLADNGSLYCFADAKICAYIQIELDKYFLLQNSIIWHKPNNMAIKGWSEFRSFAPVTERLLFYSNYETEFNKKDKTGLETIKLDVNNFKSLRKYFKEFQKNINLTKKEMIKKIGQRVDHCFRFNSTQWDMPTKETYLELCKLPLKYDFVRKEYENLRKEYEDLRRPFNQVENYTDIWVHPITSQKEKRHGYHPTQKPKKIIDRIINCSSRKNDIILDCFLGSGTTARSAKDLGCKCIGIEKDEKSLEISANRMLQEVLF